MRPPMPALTLSRRAKIILSVIVAVIVVIILATSLVGVYINFLWFGSVGHRGVYSTVLYTRLVLFGIFGALMALILAGNMVVAYLIRPPFRPMSNEQQNLERYRVMLEPRKRWLIGLIAAIVWLAAGLAAQNNWRTWTLWLNGGSFGQKDPQFGLDISFYAWDYPVYRLLLGFGFFALFFAIVLSIGVHYLFGAIRLQTPGPKVTLAARRHLTILVFLFISLKAVAYWLDRYGLVFSSRGTVTGASYTDVNVSLTAKTILFWIAIIIAVIVLASMWLKSARLPIISFVALLVISILAGGIYPAAVQQFSVKPNASNKEQPFIKRNITATREAYGITTNTSTNPATPNGIVNYQNYNVSTTPTENALTSTPNPTVSNIRILDPNVVSPTFQQLQQGPGGSVYGFADKLDVDRYTAPVQPGDAASLQDYIVGVRELDAAGLSGDQANWINKHTVFTHGYGFVAAAANQNVTNGVVPFTEGGIPASGTLGLKQPDAYYGELLPDYSIVGASGTPQEYDGSGAKITYKGSGGVSLSNPLTRLAFAVKYKETSFVLNRVAGAKGARVIFDRDPREMVKKVAPFLTVDGDPYPIIDPTSGDIVWMVDGYTTMSNFPYSQKESLADLTADTLTKTDKTAAQPNKDINYIRNSVKATVDAYTGKVTLYAWDQTDPVLQAWMKAFPGLVQPKASMPSSIQSHVRYPEDLFEVQRALIGTYHVDDPVTFYNAGNKWNVPVDPADNSTSQPPYYVMAAPPGSTASTPEFQLTSPMIVNNKTNLAAYVSVDSDPGPNYGKFTVLTVAGANTNGPQQVANKFGSNSAISSNLTLLNGTNGGSTIIHGNLLTLPIGNSFLYIEPLYVQQSTTGGYPTLQAVMASYGEKLGFASTVQGALENLFHGATGAGFSPNGQGNSTTGPTTTTPPPSTSAPPSTTAPTITPSVPPSVDKILDQLDKASDQLQAALQTGDLAKIGAAEQQVATLTKQYQAARSAEATPTAKPSSGAAKPTSSRTPASVRSPTPTR
jgi:uncharacterized membrane protein (UPF0182 family)